MASSLFDTDFLTRLTIKRLAELNKSRAKVAELERRAGLLTEFEAERRRLDILSRLSDHYSSLSPQLQDMSAYVMELKQYLQSVYDADVTADPLLQQLARDHCIGYTVSLMDMMSDASKYSSKGSYGVLELATSTLAIFSHQPDCTAAINEAGAVPVMVKLLSPLFPAVAVVNVANAVGNLAADSAARLAFRAGGGVGALVRLLRPDVEAAAQTAAAAALSLLAARDIVIQDSVRYLGGIDLLVDLLASNDTYLAEVARYCLLSLRHGNIKNQTEIITSIRSNAALVKDIRRLDAASELLRFEDGTPLRAATLQRDRFAREATSVRHLITDIDTTFRTTTPLLQSTLSPRHTASTWPRAAADNLRSSRTSLYATAPAAPLATDPLPVAPLNPVVRSLAASLEAEALRASIAAARSSELAAALTSPRASLQLAAVSALEDDWKASGGLVELESEVLRKKHLARFTAEEVCQLLEEMGFDKLDLRGFRARRVTGAQLLNLVEDELSIDMLLPKHKVRKVKALQRATRAFDRVATLTRQGKVSEVEFRLFLVAQGASKSDVDKVIKLVRTLVKVDRHDFIAFWDWVTSWDWIQQAMRIYHINTV